MLKQSSLIAGPLQLLAVTFSERLAYELTSSMLGLTGLVSLIVLGQYYSFAY